MQADTLELFDAPVQTIDDWGATLCVAPHPDDEALGCGGTLAMLSRGGARVGIVWVSDGGLSHPNSPSHPRAKLAALRESEARKSAQILGAAQTFFQRLPDGALPFPGDDGFDKAVKSAYDILVEFAPQTLLLPWRRDPHRDHRASWLIWATAAQHHSLQRYEYLVWAFERAARDEWPRRDEARAFRVDVANVLEIKRAAIEAHASQVSDLIDDDPTAFRLSSGVLAHFDKPFENWIRPFYHAPGAGWQEKPAFEQ